MRPLITVCFVLLLTCAAHAHSWYPAHCCHEMDCAPVDKVEIVPVPQVQAGMSLLPPSRLPTQMFVTTKHGTVLVPDGFKHETSKDGAMHACIRDVPMVGKKLICIFDPPAM